MKEINQIFKLTPEDSILELEGELHFASTQPIVQPAVDECTIKGDGSVVTMRVAEDQQPVIGIPTNTGLSYGRWEKASRPKCRKIILDNIHLTLISKVQNFSIGNYGYSDMPEIELINGATLEAPDYNQELKRFMTYCQPYPAGSTKLSEPCEYVMSVPGEEENVSKHCRELLAKKKLKVGDIKIPEKFLDSKIPLEVTSLVTQAIKKCPGYYDLIEADNDSTMMLRAKYYCIASKMGASVDEVKFACSYKPYYYKNNIIGEMDLCECVAITWYKYNNIEIPEEAAEKIKQYVNKTIVEEADEDMVEVLWEMIPPYSSIDFHRDKREVCLEYYGG